MNATNTLIILTPGFPASEADSTCIPSCQLFVKACQENYPSVKIIVLTFQYPFSSGTYKWHGIKVKSFNGRNKGKASRLITWCKVWMAMKTILKENRVIGVLSFWLGECSLIGNKFCKRYNLQHFSWIRGQDAKKTNAYQKYINPPSHNLVALSDFLAREYLKNFGVKPAHIVPVGIDPSMFNVIETGRDIDVLGAGSLIPLKRYHLFIDIIHELIRYFPQILVVICGKGPEKNRLTNKIEKAGLQNNILLLDELAHKEVLNLMLRSKVFFHPSEYEGYGTVCAEALYAGAHVVSFCKPMDRDNEQMHIVKTSEEAIDKIKNLLQDENRIHKRVLDYSVKDISKQIMDLFTV
jgi:glycosyltransferase involved in cell wall biosynthesis